MIKDTLYSRVPFIMFLELVNQPQVVLINIAQTL